MVMTAQEQKELAGHTCPNYQPDFSGYCQECYRRTDCTLQSMVHKLDALKTKSAR